MAITKTPNDDQQSPSDNRKTKSAKSAIQSESPNVTAPDAQGKRPAPTTTKNQVESSGAEAVDKSKAARGGRPAGKQLGGRRPQRDPRAYRNKSTTESATPPVNTPQTPTADQGAKPPSSRPPRSASRAAPRTAPRSGARGPAQSTKEGLNREPRDNRGHGKGQQGRPNQRDYKGGGRHRGSMKGREPQMKTDEQLLEEENLKVKPSAQTIDLTELKKKSIVELNKIATEKNIDCSRLYKSDIIFALLKAYSDEGDIIYASCGVLEILPDGFGFLRSVDNSFLSGPDDIYVSPNQIRRYHLRTGDMISGRIRPPKEQERYFAMLQVQEINYDAPESIHNKSAFENLTPLFPDEIFTLERGNGTSEDLAPRVVQAFCPIGKGQRGLIVSQPKAGKTMMLQSIAHSISANHPECCLIVLLIDERPEEVTEMVRSVKGEVVASTFDEPATRHVQVAEMVIERAKRLVEHKRDVVILLDSITRLARAYNTVIPSSGKVLTGGVDANALQRPKRIFGAARKVEEGGSLTIIATALVDTGSKMDEVIFEEFKGTGNMEVHLDRRMAEKRIYPAINVNRSGTRREELMLSPEELRRMWIIRKVLHPMEEIGASEFLLERMRQTKTNAEFFESMK